ncbi:hypothetical protein N5S76_06725 [Aliarcobacter cryaerophilus]|uniref:hypothetical protein n=1 Tax=Aliarcobacter cryaerophilus TaxID=28198 RepID=UPI0021B60424|nr:hypothetical protein [Aliarcobacter cryaerophilus]MCT7499459.1 hypothetical protein [Aliarcobacter cryaerophilus]
MTNDDPMVTLVKAIIEAINNASTKASIEAIKISTGKEPTQEEKDSIFNQIDEVTIKTFREYFKEI